MTALLGVTRFVRKIVILAVSFSIYDCLDVSKTCLVLIND
ncbi:hypothetical protein LINPERPRIM_LOCUS1902 [Linum perenne]